MLPHRQLAIAFLFASHACALPCWQPKIGLTAAITAILIIISHPAEAMASHYSGSTGGRMGGRTSISRSAPRGRMGGRTSISRSAPLGRKGRRSSISRSAPRAHGSSHESRRSSSTSSRPMQTAVCVYVDDDHLNTLTDDPCDHDDDLFSFLSTFAVVHLFCSFTEESDDVDDHFF